MKEFENIKPDVNNKTYERGIFGSRPNLEARIINDNDKLRQSTEALRALGLEIVLTSGTFDLVHIGHAKYLEEAKKYGDILIVGVDSDEKVRRRKGPERPVVPEEERIQMLANLRSVDVIIVKQPDEAKWGLIKLVQPDTLVVTRETYNEEDLDKLREFCGQIVILEPQATTSTSAQIRRLQVGWSSKIREPIEEILKEHNADVELCRKIGNILLGRNNEQ